MKKVRNLRRLGTIAALLAVTPVSAEIYQCKDDLGNIAFSQTPCKESPSTRVSVAGSSSSDTDCRFAVRFASHAGRLMQAGQSSSELFSRYGGIDALSRGAVGVVSYVYSFRSNQDVSVERIASLSEAKCKAAAFGDVSCAAMPASFIDSQGGCELPPDPPPQSELPQAPVSPADSPLPYTADTIARSASPARANEDKAACRKRFRDEIDRIDARMRQGYSSEQGERFREQLIELTKRLRSC